jgi:hypothetical protein
MALIVSGQQIGDVDVEIEQIANRVAVLGAVQAMNRFVAGIGSGERRAIERLLQVHRDALDRRLIGARHALRRHHPAAQLEHDLLPDLRMRSRVGQLQALEREAAGLQAFVVAGLAVLLNQRLIVRG